MSISSKNKRPDLFVQIRWTILSRACFGIVLILFSLVFSLEQGLSFFSQPFLALYNIAAIILILSIVYLVWLHRFSTLLFLAYSQCVIDTVIVSAIIFVTGAYDSIFTFLYLVVIVYTAMLLLHRGSLIIASLSCLLYAIMIELEYYRIISPFNDNGFYTDNLEVSHVIYRIIVVILACFAVAILSGLLAAQLKGARQDLRMMQQHLKRAEKMEALDELISGIAHEVKNPLASLSGSIQLLHEDTVPGSYEDKLMQIILRETERLKDIVNDIRLFSKPLKDKAKKVDISASIKEICAIFRHDPEYRPEITLTLALEARCQVFIDPDHLKQILWNLLKNAAQAIDGHGEIRVSLRTGRRGRVYLDVMDSGNGIKEKEAAHIFDPFYTSKPDGTGLGLPIIHRLIDTYGGMIDFESVPGKGTVFTVLFNEKKTDSPLSDHLPPMPA